MKSRFVRTIRWRLPRHRRSYKVFGAEEDRGRYIKCWNCGFLIDLSKTDLSGDTSGIQITETTPEAAPDGPGTGAASALQSDSPFLHWLAGNIDPMTSQDMYAPHIAEAVRGCPFCGTTNLP